MSTFVRLLALLCLTLAVHGVEPTFAGEWETTYGRMRVKVDGAKASGTYQEPGGPLNEIRGTVDGAKWAFTYSETSATGEGTFTLAEDGRSISGQWREAGTKQWHPWAGKRPAVLEQDFSGVWKTTYGSMRLIQKGTQVIGCYSFGGQSEIVGSVQGGTLKFTYTEPTGAKGSGEFKLADDSDAFSGTWKTTDGKQGAEWKGTRMTPTPGRTWLVVLEAHWESNIQQEEYSYGDMLRHFFARVPSVAVRHRFFDGKTDFAKWCAELPYLLEPVVFYVSSHGTMEGITVGNEVLTGEFIGKQLRYAAAVKLVHLGACLTLGGPEPAALRKASGLDFPVSGFTKEADWAGSAVIDFSYLDLVLSRQIVPAEAVKQIQSSVSFAGEKPTPGCAISPAGLKIVQ